MVNALAAQDGEQVTCEGVVVDRIAARNDPPYFVVHGAWRADERIVVICRLPVELMRGHVLDLVGTIQTLQSGERCIVSPTIYARLEQDGSISNRPPLFDSLPVLESRLLASASGGPIPPSDPSLPADGLGLPGPVTAWPTDSAWPGGSVTQLLSNPPPLLSRVVLSCKPIREVGEGFIVVGDDNSASAVKVYTNHPVSPGDRIVNLIAFAHSQDGNLVLYADSGESPYFDVQGELGSLQTVKRHRAAYRALLSEPPEGSIPYARTFNNGNSVTVTSAVVAADGADFPGALYVQETDRCAGIRVLYTGSAQIERGDEVEVIGEIGVGDDGERQIDAGSSGLTYIDDHGVPEPLGMPNGSLGGDDANPYTPGITGAYGIYNKGLLVKSWGRVTAVDAGNKCFYIDDGSRLDDGSGNVGVKVSWDWPTAGKAPIMPPVQGWYVSVTGISGSEWHTVEQQQVLVRVLRLRGQWDIDYLDDAAGDWPMFMHDPQHTGMSRIWDVAGETLTPAWPAPVDVPTAATERDYEWRYWDGAWIKHPNPAGGGPLGTWIFEHPYIDSSPVVVGSRVVVGTWTRGTKYPFPGEQNPATGSVKTFNAASNGATLWTATGDPSMGGVASTPCISNDRVYVGTTNGYFYCLDLDTGDQIWARPTYDRSENLSTIISSVVVHDGVVYITNEASKIYAFSADANGARIWSDEPGQQHEYPPIELPIDEVGHGDDVDDDGVGDGVTDVRQQNICGASSPAIAIVAGQTYLLVGCDDGWVYRIDLSDRSMEGLDMGGCVESSPSVLGNYAYLGVTIFQGQDLQRITIDPLEHAGYWELGEESRATPSLAYDHVYNGVDTGHILYRVHDPDTDPLRQYLPQFVAPGEYHYFVGSAAHTTGDIVYTGNDNGHFYALNADDLTEIVSGGYYNGNMQEPVFICSSPAIGYNADANYNRWVFITTRGDGGKLYAFKTMR